MKFLKRPAWVRHDEHYHVNFAVNCVSIEDYHARTSTTTPATVSATPRSTRASNFSSRKKSALSASVKSGYVATSGDTTLTCPRLSAAYMASTPTPLQNPT